MAAENDGMNMVQTSENVSAAEKSYDLRKEINGMVNIKIQLFFFNYINKSQQEWDKKFEYS